MVSTRPAAMCGHRVEGELRIEDPQTERPMWVRSRDLRGRGRERARCADTGPSRPHPEWEGSTLKSHSWPTPVDGRAGLFRNGLSGGENQQALPVMQPSLVRKT